MDRRTDIAVATMVFGRLVLITASGDHYMQWQDDYGLVDLIILPFFMSDPDWEDDIVLSILTRPGTVYDGTVSASGHHVRFLYGQIEPGYETAGSEQAAICAAAISYRRRHPLRKRVSIHA